MKKIFLSLVISFSGMISYSQVVKILGDSTKFYQTGSGHNELIIENATKGNTKGFLQNNNNGRTKFAFALDSVWREGDLLKFRRGTTVLSFNLLVDTSSGAVDTTSLSNRINLKLNISDTSNKWVNNIYRTPGIDSIYFRIGATVYAIKDSTGGGDGGLQTLQQTIDLEPGGALTTKGDTVILNTNDFTFLNTGGTTNGLIRLTKNDTTKTVILPGRIQLYSTAFPDVHFYSRTKNGNGNTEKMGFGYDPGGIDTYLDHTYIDCRDSVGFFTIEFGPATAQFFNNVPLYKGRTNLGLLGDGKVIIWGPGATNAVEPPQKFSVFGSMWVKDSIVVPDGVTLASSSSIDSVWVKDAVTGVFKLRAQSDLSIIETQNWDNVLSQGGSQSATRKWDANNNTLEFDSVANFNTYSTTNSSFRSRINQNQFTVLIGSTKTGEANNTIQAGSTGNQIFSQGTGVAGTFQYFIKTDTLGISIKSNASLTSVEQMKLFMDGTNTTFTDSRGTTKGIEYAANYGSGFTSRSLIDKGYADSLHALSSGDVTLAAFGSTPNANGLTLSGQVLNMEPASNSQPGGVSTTTQTFAGAKTFNGSFTTAKAFYLSSSATETVNANINDYALSSTVSYVHLEPSSGSVFDFTGMDPGASPQGRIVILFCNGAGRIAIKNESSSSTAANRIIFNNAIGDIILHRKQSIMLRYELTNPAGLGGRWEVVSRTPVLFNTTDFVEESLGGEITLSYSQVASSGVTGYLSGTDWDIFNGKQGAITLTTTGTSGAATLISNTLNIPQYSGGGGYTNLTQFVDQTNWIVPYTNGSGDVQELALGAAGTYLQSNGASSAPTWVTPSGSPHVIQEEGTPLTARANLNFIGTAVTATDNSGANSSDITFDSDLNTIAGLIATTDNFLVSVASAWASRTPAQVKTTLGLVIGTDVQAYDADLTTYAGITPSANVQTLLGSADYSAFRTSLGLVIGTNVQAFDADLTTWAGLTPTTVGQNLVTLTNPSAITFLRINADNTVTARSAANFKTDLSLTIGTDVQAFDADLTTWAGITPGTGVGTFLATPSSANLASAVTDETGSGSLVFGTSPRITTGINDANGNELFLFTATGSAVNEITIANGATGNNATITASGETNTGITITGKGTKGVSVGNALLEKVVTVSDGAGAVIDASLGNVFTWTAAADRTAGTTTNPTVGQKMIISFIASGGARTLTLPTATTGDFAFGSDITGLTQTASGKGDMIGCVYGIPVANRWNIVAVAKGY